MKPVSPLNLAQSLGAADEDRKLNSTVSINRHSSGKGLLKNLLENSLTCKLKQHRLDHSSSNKENISKAVKSKPPKNKRQTQSSAASESKRTSQHTILPCNSCVSFVDRNDSAASSVRSADKIGKNEKSPVNGHIDGYNTNGDQLPKLSRRTASPLDYPASRRSSSADLLLSRVSSHSGTSRMTSASSFFHSSYSVGLAFESRGTEYTVKVVKKDGVFQPIDKYASNRNLARETGAIACDYQLFTLPLTRDDASALKPNPRDQYNEGNRKPLKVSWSKTMDTTTNEEMEAVESKIDSVPPPVTPNNLIRAMSSSSFKRPNYSSGKSRVQSIGLQWRVPTVSPDDEETTTEQSPKKPMWSWLVAPEAKQKGKLRTVKHLSRGSKNSSTSCLNRYASSNDVRIQHSRDLHPVATAMAREGTSVSKTKWFVPSSSASTQDAERLVMDRLELVKRERKARADAYDADDSCRNVQTNEIDENESDPDEIEAMKKQMDDSTSYDTKSNIDTITSPAKSRSTNI